MRLPYRKEKSRAARVLLTTRLLIAAFCTGYQDRTKVKGDFPILISRAIPVPFALHYI